MAASANTTDYQLAIFFAVQGQFNFSISDDIENTVIVGLLVKLLPLLDGLPMAGGGNLFDLATRHVSQKDRFLQAFGHFEKRAETALNIKQQTYAILFRFSQYLNS